MSRIGKKPVEVPAGVTASVDGQTVTAKGPKGELKFVVNDEVLVKMENGAVSVDPRDQSKDARSKWGMSRTMISNIFTGVKDGFEKKLEINGVGYRAAMQGKNLQLSLGFSHEVIYEVPEGVSATLGTPEVAGSTATPSMRSMYQRSSSEECMSALSPVTTAAPIGAPVSGL